MTTVNILAGDLTANREERVVSGLLVPYGEIGNTNLGRFSIPGPGLVTIPADVSVLNANEDHSPLKPRARFLTATDTPGGIVASMRVGKNPEGDALLARAERAKAAGKPLALSVEIADVVLRAGKFVSGMLSGGAFVDRGAFPSAALMAADVGEVEDDETDAGAATTTSHDENTFTDENGVTWTRTADTETTVEDNKTTTTTTVVEETTEPTDESDNPEGETVPEATAPNALTANRAGTSKALTFAGLTTMLGRAKATNDAGLFASIANEQRSADALFAALNDITFDKNATDAGSQIQLPQWLGELWNGRANRRRIIPLINSAPLTSLKIAAWRWLVEPEVGPWDGNKTNVPSNTPTTEGYEVTANRLAGAHDIDRQYRDFDVPGFWEGYFKGMTNSYDRQADEGTLDDLLLAATPVERGTVPTGVAAGMASIVDGALSIVDEGLPSFAVVSKDLYRDILLTRNDDTLAHFNAALGLDEGTISSFTVVPHKNLDAGTVLVGAREAATSHELGGGAPIRVEGLDMVRGGIDVGVFGYYGTVIHSEAALALVTDSTP